MRAMSIVFFVSMFPVFVAKVYGIDLREENAIVSIAFPEKLLEKLGRGRNKAGMDDGQGPMSVSFTKSPPNESKRKPMRRKMKRLRNPANRGGIGNREISQIRETRFLSPFTGTGTGTRHDNKSVNSED
jgi:hypothetical protein